MTTRVDGYEHREGIFCGSTAIRNLLGWAGLQLSEPLAFGLGAGLDFHYLCSETSPTRRILGRSLALEDGVADSLGLTVHTLEPGSPHDGMSVIETYLADGVPVLVRCDGSRLPYRDRYPPYGARRVVVVGLDADGGRVSVSDGAIEEVTRVERDEFLHAWWSEDLPEAEGGGVAHVFESDPTRELDEAILRAVARNCREMTTRDGQTHGLEALSRFREEVGQWKSLDDGTACYRAAYQAMECPETGGGNYRSLYREFLKEAEQRVPSLGNLQAGLSMTRTADAWSTLGTYLSAMTTYLATDGEEPGENPAHHVESMAEAVYQFESTFWDRIRSLEG